MPKKPGLDPAQFGLFATPLEAIIAADAGVLHKVCHYFFLKRNKKEVQLIWMILA